MEVKFFQEFFFDPSADAIAKQSPVRHDDGGASELVGTRSTASLIILGRGGTRPYLTQLPHDKLEKQKGGFGGLFVLGKIALNAFLFFATKRRIREDHIHTITLADVGELEAEGIPRVNLRRIKTVQQKV